MEFTYTMKKKIVIFAKNIPQLDILILKGQMIKYLKGNIIELEKKLSELSKWKELVQILPQTWERCEKNQGKWTELAKSQGRTYECFLYEVEQTIKNLGG
jgi:hypothetical protein